MKKHNAEAGSFNKLRQQAEDWLGVNNNQFTASDRDPAADTHRLIHELHVHQIELEMQNEELERVRTELENNLARVIAMYEFAPIGYLTLDTHGVLRAINLTGARMLALARSQLVGRRFANFLPVENRSAFDNFLANAFAGHNEELYELVLRPAEVDMSVLEFTALVSEDGKECHLTANDVTRRKQAEQVCVSLKLQLEQSRPTGSFGAHTSDMVNDVDLK